MNLELLDPFGRQIPDRVDATIQLPLALHSGGYYKEIFADNFDEEKRYHLSHDVNNNPVLDSSTRQVTNNSLDPVIKKKNSTNKVPKPVVAETPFSFIVPRKKNMDRNDDSSSNIRTRGGGVDGRISSKKNQETKSNLFSSTNTNSSRKNNTETKRKSSINESNLTKQNNNNHNNKDTTKISACPGDDDDEDYAAAYHVTFNRRGTYLAVGYGSGIVAIYSIMTRTLIALYRSGSTIPTSFSTTNHQNQKLKSDSVGQQQGQGQQKSNNNNNSNDTEPINHGCSCISWSRRSRTLLCGAYDDSYVKLIDTTHPYGPEECYIGLLSSTPGILHNYSSGGGGGNDLHLNSTTTTATSIHTNSKNHLNPNLNKKKGTNGDDQVTSTISSVHDDDGKINISNNKIIIPKKSKTNKELSLTSSSSSIPMNVVDSSPIDESTNSISTPHKQNQQQQPQQHQQHNSSSNNILHQQQLNILTSNLQLDKVSCNHGIEQTINTSFQNETRYHECLKQTLIVDTIIVNNMMQTAESVMTNNETNTNHSLKQDKFNKLIIPGQKNLRPTQEDREQQNCTSPSVHPTKEEEEGESHSKIKKQKIHSNPLNHHHKKNDDNKIFSHNQSTVVGDDIKNVPKNSSTTTNNNYHIRRYPMIKFSLPHPVAGSLQLNPKRPTGGLAVLTNGALVVFWIHSSVWIVETDSKKQKVNDTSESNQKDKYKKQTNQDSTTNISDPMDKSKRTSIPNNEKQNNINSAQTVTSLNHEGNKSVPMKKKKKKHSIDSVKEEKKDNSHDNTLHRERKYDTPKVIVLTLYEKKSNFIMSACFDPSGNHIYAATKDGAILGFDVAKVWRIITHNVHQDRTIRLPPNKTTSTSASPSNVQDNKSNCKKSILKPKFKISIPGSSACWHILVSKNGKFIIINSADGAMRLYPTQELWDKANTLSDTNAIKPKFTFQDVVSRIKFASCDLSGDGEYIVGGANGIGDGNKYELYVWNTSTGALMDKLTGPAYVTLYSVAWHPTRSLLAVATSDGIIDIWGPRINWTAFAPDFQALPMNVEYIEREDEFDIDVSTIDDNNNNNNNNTNGCTATLKKYFTDYSRDDELEEMENSTSVDVITVEPVPVFASDSESEEDVFAFETNVTNLFNTYRRIGNNSKKSASRNSEPSVLKSTPT